MITILEHLFSFKLWFLKLLTLFFIFFEPAKESALLLLFLIVVDALTHIWIQINSKQKINVKRFCIKLMQDITLFFIYILTIHYFQVSYLKETFTVFRLLAGIPIIALLSQIIVNIETLTGIKIASKAKNILNDLFSSMTKKSLPKE